MSIVITPEARERLERAVLAAYAKGWRKMTKDDLIEQLHNLYQYGCPPLTMTGDSDGTTDEDLMELAGNLEIKEEVWR